MLDVPEEIKHLLRESSTSKNLRIHFPDGERKDITNDNLVSESFSFTESLCSRDELKLGLCEASTVEFETIGVGNIKGCKIECYCEIDISSLNEEFITEYGIVSDDVGYPYYRIPYGTFVVDSCPRDAGNMQLRKVCAYSKIAAENWEWNKDFVRAVCYPWAHDTDVEVAIEDIIRVHFPETEEFTEEDLVTDYWSGVVYEAGEYLLYVTYIQVDETIIDGYVWNYKICIDEEYCKMIQSLIRFVDTLEFSDADNKKELLKGIDNCAKYAIKGNSFMSGIDTYQYLKTVTRSDDIVTKFISSPRINCPKVFGYYMDDTGDFDEMDFSLISDLQYSNTEYFPGIREWPASNDENHIIFRAFIRVPIRVKIWKKPGDLILFESTKYNNLLYSKKRKISSGRLPSIRLKRTLVNTRNIESHTGIIEGAEAPYTYNVVSQIVSRTDYSVNAAIFKQMDLKNLLENYCELKGAFGKFDRSGKFDLLKLNSKVSLFPSETLYPREELYPNGVETLLSRALYSKVWYADERTKLYNKVTCVYKNSSEIQQAAEHIIVDINQVDDEGNLIYDPNKYQEYDITNNYFIKNGTYSEEEISEILANVASGLVGIQYMPAEVETKGRPDIEVGDGLQVLTESDGFETIVLRRTLSGVQALSDEYESK